MEVVNQATDRPSSIMLMPNLRWFCPPLVDSLKDDDSSFLAHGNKFINENKKANASTAACCMVKSICEKSMEPVNNTV